MLVYPDYSKVPSLERLFEITARLSEKPENERNEYASIWLSDLQRELTPKSEGNDAEQVEADVRSTLAKGREIDAMKLARARLGIGLKEAYDYVQRLKWTP